VAIIWLLSQASAREFAIEGLALAAASAFYFTVGRRSPRRAL
jgi:hypothetical protein